MQKKAEMRPRLKNALIGAAVGGIPSALYGALTSKSPISDALTYGLLGSGVGGSIGYLCTLSTKNTIKEILTPEYVSSIKKKQTGRFVLGKIKTELDKMPWYARWWGDIPISTGMIETPPWALKTKKVLKWLPI